MVSYVQVPSQQGKRNAFIESKKEDGRALVNNESMDFLRLSPCQERRVFLLPVGLCYSCRV